MMSVNGTQAATRPEMTFELLLIVSGQCLVRNGRDCCRPRTDFAVLLLW